MKSKPEQKLTFEEYVKLRETRRVGETKRIIKQNEKDKNKKGKKESVVSRTLKIARILKDNGIDFTKIQLNKGNRGTLLEEIKQDGIDMQKIIEENGLDGKFRFGESVKGLRLAYKGIGSYKITEEEKNEAEKLGLIEIKREKESIASITLKIVRILKDNGIDFTKTQLNRGKRGILLEEIEQDEIDMQKMIEKYNLDGKFKIRTNIVDLKAAYNNSGKYRLTEKERREAEELGVLEIEIETEIENIISKTLKIARILKDNGINFAPIKFYRGNEGILLEEIEQDGIDMQKIIKKYNLDGKFPIRNGSL